MAGGELTTKEGLAAALEQRRQDVTAFFGGLSEAVFFDGSAERWSPAHHLDHLIRSNRPVAQMLGTPRLALAAFGGTKTRPSRSFETLSDTYQGQLRQGGRASGRYAPDLGRYVPDPQGQAQAQIVQAFEDASGALGLNLDPWLDTDLDRYQLPHPLLGPLTVRELLYFTLYHNGHHLDGVRARLQGSGLASSAPPG